MDFIRIWNNVDITEIENKLLIVDDLFGFCPGCREMGIKLNNLKKCPKCDREFKYVTSREAKNGGRSYDIVMRTKKKLPDLIFIDIGDYERALSKKKGENLFKDM